MKPKMWVSFGLVLACMLLVTGTGQAQTAVQVFLQRGQPDQLQFVDMYTGEIDTVAVSGERYTVFGSAVMYYDPVDNRVRLATAGASVCVCSAFGAWRAHRVAMAGGRFAGGR